MFLTSFVFLAGLQLASTPTILETEDTLKAVTIVADRGLVVSRTDTLSSISSKSVSGLILSVPTLGLTDYGGNAALKNVNMRGLGSAHTVIYLDGVRVSDINNGQRDLGFIDMSSISSLVVDYAQNSLSFKTERPEFGDKKVTGKIYFSGGSFGSFLPSGRLSVKISDKLSVSAHTAAVISKGNYEYAEGKTRENNDIQQIKGGLDFFGTLKGGEWQAKALINKAERGTPGSIDWPSITDRQNDLNCLIQGSANKAISDIYKLQLSSKIAVDQLEYLSTWGNSNYNQKEFQLNSSHYFKVGKCIQLSLAADLQWDGLETNEYKGKRFGLVTAIAAALNLERFKSNAAIEYSGSFDRFSDQKSDFNSISPSIDIRYSLTEGLDLTAFARRAYRNPTFNELYYPGFGNPELLAEDAFLSDIGIYWHHKASESLSLDAKLDAYHNSQKNRIISFSSPENSSIWLPYNVGKVKSTGIDISAGMKYQSGDYRFVLDLRYSYQDAKDKTEGSLSYNRQIPFIAKHSAFASATSEYRGYRLEFSYSSRFGRQDAQGEMPAWNNLDLGLNKTFSLSHDNMNLTLGIIGRNILDCRYELVRSYPMPPRSLMALICMNF